LLRLVGGELSPIAGKLGDGSIPATHPASSPEGDQLAALSPAGDRLFLTTPSAGAPVRTPLVAPNLTAPSWDPFGSVWTTSRSGDVTTVWAVRPGDDPPVRVSAPGLADQRVVALRVARDGVRVAVVVGDKAGGRNLLVGRIERGENLKLDGLRRVESTLVDVVDVAWADADRMAVLGQEPNGVVQPLIVDADGSVRRAAGSLSGLVRIAAAPGKPLVAGTSDGTIWLDTDVGWQTVGKGFDPAYPG
jgi:two-component system sensor histidine kinase MtrB